VEKELEVNRAQLAHAYIIASPNEEKGKQQAQYLAQKMMCAEPGSEPCGQCSDCRKIQKQIHPDVIVVDLKTDDHGKSRREIYVDQIRSMISDAYIKPNEGNRKIYIIYHADKMNIQSQNAALKLLEEPPVYASFILCAENPERLLPTVRSRCGLITLNTEQEAADEEEKKLAEEFVERFRRGDEAALCAWTMKNNGMDTAAASRFLTEVKTQLIEGLKDNSADISKNQQTIRMIELLEQCQGYLSVNVSVKHLFGLLAVQAISGGKDNKQ